MDDFGLQHAIFASIQMHHAAHRAAIASITRQSVGFVRLQSMGERSEAPPPVRRFAPSPPRPGPILRSVPTAAGGSGSSVTRGGACAREGILPTIPSRSGPTQTAPKRIATRSDSRPKQPAVPRPGAPQQAPSSNISAGGEVVAPSDDPFEAMIEREILLTNPNVAWDDVAGQAVAKRLLNEALVLPLLVPELFTGLRTPWRGVLLYGPPGTGKTLLAKAVATSGQAAFFNISAATLLSRYHGESEKIVRALFNCARRRSPSVIFIDEVDALMRSRGAGSEHEASRRVKAELLQQLDGVPSGDERVMLLCTTNMPWDLDEALIRRLEKRIYVALPDSDGKKDLLSLNAKKVALATETPDAVDLDAVAAAMPQHYSGADIHSVCREASMRPLRRVVDGKRPEEIAALKSEGRLNPETLLVTQQDFLDAVTSVQPSVSGDLLDRYEEWSTQHGAAA